MRKIILLLVLTCAALQKSAADDSSNVPLDTINQTQIIATVERVADEFKNRYLNAETGAQAAVGLRNALKNKNYVGITSATTFAARLTKDLYDLTHDGHARLLINSGTSSNQKLDSVFRVEPNDQLYRLADFERVDRLKGNIGYIKLKIFTRLSYFKPKADSVMQLLADTDALIIDLRGAFGGDTSSIAYFCSFFLPDSEPVLLSTIIYRDRPATESWTTSVSQHYLDKPIYILTSKTTFSGAEEVAYDLKALGRAMLVGETTQGGAHGSQVIKISDQFSVMIPSIQPLNAITHSNWEGSGVTPHIAAPAAQALAIAATDYVSKALPNTSDFGWKSVLEKLAIDIKASGDAALY